MWTLAEMTAVRSNADDKQQQKLRRRELNPGLPREMRKYEPLYYSGSDMVPCKC